MDPDFTLREPEALPYGGDYKGIEGFKTCWNKIKATIATESLETVRTFFADDADHMVCELAVKGKVIATGKRYDSHVFEQWQLRSGKILAITLYWFKLPDFETC